METLSNIFELDKKDVKKIISKMILDDKLQAHIEHKSELIVIDEDGTDINHLQQLSR